MFQVAREMLQVTSETFDLLYVICYRGYVSNTKKKSLKSKIEFNSLCVERHPGDGTYLLLKDKHTQEIKHKFQTKTRRPVDGLMYSCSRLAVLTGGRVYVYDTKILARGNHGGALLLEPNRNTDDEVHFMLLNENVLVTVGGCKVTMYDFWRFTWSSATRDFQT